MGLGFWVTVAILSLSAFFAAFIDGRKKAERLGAAQAELKHALEALDNVRSELRRSRRSTATVAELRRMFDTDDA